MICRHPKQLLTSIFLFPEVFARSGEQSRDVQEISLSETTTRHSEIHIDSIFKIFNFDFWTEIDAAAILCLCCCRRRPPRSAFHDLARRRREVACSRLVSIARRRLGCTALDRLHPSGGACEAVFGIRPRAAAVASAESGVVELDIDSGEGQAAPIQFRQCVPVVRPRRGRVLDQRRRLQEHRHAAGEGRVEGLQRVSAGVRRHGIWQDLQHDRHRQRPW